MRNLLSYTWLFPNTEVHIKTFGVGLLALVAVTAASILLRRRRPALAAAGSGSIARPEDLYPAGL